MRVYGEILMLSFNVRASLAKDKDNDFWLVIDDHPTFMLLPSRTQEDQCEQPARWAPRSWDDDYGPLQAVGRLEFLIDVGADAGMLLRGSALDGSIREVQWLTTDT